MTALSEYLLKKFQQDYPYLDRGLIIEMGLCLLTEHKSALEYENIMREVEFSVDTGN